MAEINLESVIEDSLTDAITPEVTETPVETVEVTETPTPDSTGDVAPDATEAVPEPIKAEATLEVASPGAKAEKPEEDDFAKKHGLPPQTVSGRENRIPYPRVKKIVEKAEKEAVAAARKVWEGESTPKLAELNTKVTDYETRLTKVGEFEAVMTTKPREFLGMLSELPAYKEFFDFVNQAIQAQGATPQAQGQAAAVGDDMPQPNEQLPDGSMVYNDAGLKALQDWQAARIEAKLTKAYEARLAEVDKQYAPLRQKWEADQHLARIQPQIQKQIEDARKWPQFNENEDEITKALQADNTLSLEGAYRQVVIPKLQANRDTMRHSLLEEIKKVPQSTSTPIRGATKPNQAPVGPQSTEDIITQSLKEAGLL